MAAARLTVMSSSTRGSSLTRAEARDANRPDDESVEDVLSLYLLERLLDKTRGRADLTEVEATRLAVEELDAMRREREAGEGGSPRQRARRPAARPTPTPRAQPPDRAGLEAFIRAYLSAQHRDQPADGCPSAALLDEIARRPATTRQAFTDELIGVIDDIASRLHRTDAEAARTDALTLLGLMLGTLQLARALTDRELSDQLLTRGVETAMKLLDNRA